MEIFLYKPSRETSLSVKVSKYQPGAGEAIHLRV